MANFLVAVDPDRDRRAAFCAVARDRIAPLAGLVVGECASLEFHALWASGPRAPVAHATTDRSATVIWGVPMTAGDGRRLTPAELAERWGDPASSPPPPFDGYFAAATYAAPGGLVVGADLLGMFPVYWWQSGEVLLVGSSPELFRHHPLFRFELDLAGLTGILLLFHSVAGRTLSAGVSRLGPGHALVWRPGSPAREVRQYRLPMSSRHFDLPAWAAAEFVDETLRRAVARHLPPDTQPALTLTGGRDSRHLAGIMVDLGRPPVAFTLGNDDDIEMECARAVAQTLHLEQHPAKVRLDRDVLCPELHARWTHCNSGFNSSEYWYTHEDLRHVPPFLVTGCVMGSIIGGALVGAAYSEVTRKSSFDTVFPKNNRQAIEVDRLRKLLRPELFGTLVDDVMQDIRRNYESFSEFESQRSFCFDLHNRQRFQTGALAWEMSFGSWPVNPVVDQEVLEVTGGISAGVMAEKRLHDEIFRSYFPALAELPLDRNGYNTTPISPRLRHRIEAHLCARLGPLARMIRRRERPGHERRFYYRLLDFNGPAWKMARRRAEPHRSKLHALFDKDALDALLPPPEVDIAAADGIADGSSKRLLVGLCLWAGANL